MSPAFQAAMREAEERFPALVGHGERTASFAVATAERLGAPPERLAALRVAAALHFSWSPTQEACPCTEPDVRHLLRFDMPDYAAAADMIRSMFAPWRMVPVEASILRAACLHDLKNIQVNTQPYEPRPGVQEALVAVAPLIVPLDYVS